MGDHITHSCSRVKETDLLISTSTDRDNPLIPQAPCWNLPHLHILTVSCLTLHRRWKTQESTLLWPSWDTRTGGTTCYKLSVFVGAMSWLFSGLLCQRNAAAPAVDQLHRCWFPQVAILQRTCFFPYGTWGPWCQPESHPKILISLLLQTVHLCSPAYSVLGKFHIKIGIFLSYSFFFILPYQGKNQFIINSFFTCWKPFHW